MRAIRGFAWLLLFQTLGELIVRGAGLPLPGPVVGMGLLVVALSWPALREDVAGVAAFLLEHLALLFVPVGVGVVVHLDRLQQTGLRLIVVLVLSTWIGMAVTALALRRLLRAPAAAGHDD